MSETRVVERQGQISTVYKKNSSQMECPVCGGMFDYLLGTDENGGRRGCELHWKPPVTPIDNTQENQSHDSLADFDSANGVAYSNQDAQNDLLNRLRR